MNLSILQKMTVALILGTISGIFISDGVSAYIESIGITFSPLMSVGVGIAVVVVAKILRIL